MGDPAVEPVAGPSRLARPPVPSIDTARLLRETRMERGQQTRGLIREGLEIIRNKKTLGLPGEFPDIFFDKLRSSGLWDRILQNVTDRSDMTSAFFSCQLFRDYLEESRKLAMLSEVLRILRDGQYLYEDDDVYHEEQSTVLKLREAAVGDKKWKEIIDNIFYDYAFAHPDWHISFGELHQYWNSLPEGCNLREEDDVEFAMTTFRKGCSPPLVRVLDVNRLHNTDTNVFHAKLAKFLSTRGNNVWGLLYTEPDKLMSQGNNYNNLRNLICSTPNLKALTLGLIDDSRHNDEELARFQQILEEKPFPRIASLQRLEIRLAPPKGNEFLIAEIITKSRNLKAITFGECGAIPDSIAQAIRGLDLECFKCRYTHPGDIFELSQFHWPLKAIRLPWFVGLNPVRIRTEHFFGVVNHFQDTLEELQVDWELQKGQYDRINIHLPNVKFMQVSQIGTDSVALADLIPMRKLEKLHVKGTLDPIQVSNIFKCFPRLKTVVTGGSMANYERHQMSSLPGYLQPFDIESVNAFNEMEEMLRLMRGAQMEALFHPSDFEDD